MITRPGSLRVISLDVGAVRIGVAVTDPTGTIAQPLEVYRRSGNTPDTKYVLSLCERFETDHILIGLPLHLNNTEGSQAEQAKDFGGVLADCGLRVEYQDERLSTRMAERALLDGNVRRRKRRLTVDKIAACIILEQWLDTHKDD